MTRTQELRTPITARKEGDWGRGTFGWIFSKNLLAEFDFLSVFTSVSSALLPLMLNSKRSLRSTFAESCSICFTFKHPPSPPLQKDLSHAGYLVPDNNAKLPPEGFGTHCIEPFASLKVRTTSLINILQGKAWCKAVESIACEQQTHFRSSLLSLRKIAIFIAILIAIIAIIIILLH